MDPDSRYPSVRELIAEYAAVEDRLRSVEADVVGGSSPQVSPEMAQLAQRERQILALLRRYHAADERQGAQEAR
jgi:hypothetical protein